MCTCTTILEVLSLSLGSLRFYSRSKEKKRFQIGLLSILEEGDQLFLSSSFILPLSFYFLFHDRPNLLLIPSNQFQGGRLVPVDQLYALLSLSNYSSTSASSYAPSRSLKTKNRN